MAKIENISFEEIQETVAGFDHYFSLNEMAQHTISLKGKGKFTIENIGQSEEGRNIELIYYDSGSSKTALLYGFEDPDEPICALTMTWICNQLLRKDSPLRRIDCNWAMIKCINPDGAKRNESWFGKPGDLRAYLDGAWEPPVDSLIMWKASPDRPELKALHSAIAKTKPDIIFDMHDESHWLSGGYAIGLSDPIEREMFSHHFKYIKSLNMPIPAVPMILSGWPGHDMRNSDAYSFHPAFKHNPKCTVIIDEACGYRHVALDEKEFDRKGYDEKMALNRDKLRIALTKYKTLLEAQENAKDPLVRSALVFVSDVEKQINENKPVQTIFLARSGSGLRALKAKGLTKEADEIEETFWEFIRASLADKQYRSTNLNDLVRAQLHFLFTVMKIKGMWQSKQ